MCSADPERAGKPGRSDKNRRRWLAAAAVLALAAIVLAGIWLTVRPVSAPAAPNPAPGAVSPPATTVPATLTALPTGLPTPAPLPPATWTAAPTPTPAVDRPTITALSADVDDAAHTITFRLEASVPPGRRIAEVLLWYDTEVGRRLRRTPGPLPDTITLSYRLDATEEGITRTVTAALDYWWLVRDTTGESVRAGGTVPLGPGLQTLESPPAPSPPPVAFSWSVSETAHYRFHYLPESAAERDRSEIGAVAEAALRQVTAVLFIPFDGQMDIYLIPRIFWQGAATYGDKVQLISYLDRNYTGVETWSYFAHEGTHALAQDLLQPKENGGGPDGVLVEGLALWAGGGHYRRDPLDLWAAVVAGSGDHIPLAKLRAGPFYDFQHETSYLEGGSFVKFLIDRYGLEPFKGLYGRATGEASHDEALVQELYGKGYSDLESDWLDYLAELSPTAEQAEAWRLRVRSFDLMRRYETELDPDARILPDQAPPGWTSDTLKIFTHPVEGSVNVVLETALIAAQERLASGDQAGASALLDDVEAALDGGGKLERPGLRARLEILDLLAAQDCAVLRADREAYLQTLDPAHARATDVEALLQTPFTTYDQEVVRLDLAGDGRKATAVVRLHAEVADVEYKDGHLAAQTLARVGARWRVVDHRPYSPVVPLPPRGPEH